jgi:hypothetical protein
VDKSRSTAAQAMVMPAIRIEIDPNLDDPTANLSTMVYKPDNGRPGVWSHLDADADPDPRWGLTGATFAGTECDINGARCTFEQRSRSRRVSEAS